MKIDSSKNALDVSPVETVTSPSDRLLTFREVHALIGSNCKSGHIARTLAADGKIRAVRLNERVIRYSEASVRALIAGRISA